MADIPKLSAFSTLASGIASNATSLSVASGHGARFPVTASEGAFNICVWDSRYKNFDVAYRAGAGEVMRCTSRSTDTFTVTRAQEGTTALAFNTTGVTYRVEQNITPIYLTTKVSTSGTETVGGLKTFTDSIAVGAEGVTTGKVYFYNESNAYNAALNASAPAANIDVYMPATGGTLLTRETAPIILGNTVSGTVTGSLYNTAFGQSWLSTSGNNRYYFRQAGTLKNLYTVVAGQASVDSLVITVMKGTGSGASSATSLETSVDPTGVTNFLTASDTNALHNVSVAIDDWFEVRATSAGAATAYAAWTVEFYPS